MKFSAILFDLDGTLSASGPGITRSAQYALQQLGISEPDPDKLTFFIGPPLNLTFREHYGMNDEQTARAVHYFRQRYDQKGVYETELYPGIIPMLQALTDSGRTLAIASSKPQPLVHQVLHNLKIHEYFTVIVGSAPEEELDNTAGADNKERRVREALEQLRKSSKAAPSEIAMVGDRFYDIQGAIANHVTPVGVSYGYGTKEELERSGAVYVAETVPDLENYLLQ